MSEWGFDHFFHPILPVQAKKNKKTLLPFWACAYTIKLRHNSGIPYTPYSFRVRIRIRVRISVSVRVRIRVRD